MDKTHLWWSHSSQKEKKNKCKELVERGKNKHNISTMLLLFERLFMEMGFWHEDKSLCTHIEKELFSERRRRRFYALLVRRYNIFFFFFF